MRYYQRLETVKHDLTSNSMMLNGTGAPSLWLGRDGGYVSMAANSGSTEITLRPRLQDLVTSLSELQPAEMQTVGTNYAHLEVGLSNDGELLLSAANGGPDAINMVLAASACEQLFQWLGVQAKKAL
jgi:hypothetical protein